MYLVVLLENSELYRQTHNQDKKKEIKNSHRQKQ